MSDIYKNINSNYERMSEAEREVVDFILKFKDIERLKLKDIKDVLYVSNATVIRACKKLNYATFSEMKAAFVRGREINRGDCPEESDFVRVVEDIKKDTLTTLELADEQTIDQICNCLINARRIFCVGTGPSFQVAFDFKRKLTLNDLWVNVYSDDYTIERIPEICKERDVIIIFSSVDQVDEINEAIIKAKGNGTKIIAVTSMSANKLKSISTYSLLTASPSSQKQMYSELMLHLMSTLIYEKILTRVPSS
ncbi:MurR/RpiR family transcriptional regulator [Enterococcus caccae]|uniref:Phosphosugar-binding transcriptional regulator n=1 Tax=Enterococcus caccae ATCC BAA-1240 TaxID=1158612 RepID=R3TVJ2_9ENTE|nr:MurR/RpiR family transcriptional regulator [Enterococcus caccae]EOL45173.1 hypothetical protein UC7_01979 [Enterococcus caccae ATCC BAA-1240]EOT58580.1 hypothetical protein I580_02751 [Enterococcus caccae ATCC BAA-1240]OJG27091.1 hypothetical protein RU98_GL002871 [Enterococcus caccae]